MIECTYLEKMFRERMDAIAARQIHSEDVRTLFLNLPNDHEMLPFLAQHVGMLLWNGDLKYKGAYFTLRKELPAFNNAINAVLDPLVAQRRAAKKAEKDEFYAKFREQKENARKGGSGPRKEARKQEYSNKATENKKASTLEEFKIVETPTSPAKKLPVPGADDVATIPYFKMNNKAAKRRQKKRDAKAAEDAGAAAE
jgi:hypothetical protein